MLHPEHPRARLPNRSIDSPARDKCDGLAGAGVQSEIGRARHSLRSRHDVAVSLTSVYRGADHFQGSGSVKAAKAIGASAGPRRCFG